MPIYILRGVLGYLTNRPTIDKGTISRSQSLPPKIRLEPITVYLPPDEFKERDKFYRKFELGLDIYKELGLAGQIAEKFLSLPYRTGGRITYKPQKLEGEGLVCTSFAKIFGAFWFDAAEQAKLGSQAVKVRPRRTDEGGKAWKIVKIRKNGEEKTGDVVGETDTKWEAEASVRDRNEAHKAVSKSGKKGISLSPALVYSDKFGGTRVNQTRLRLRKLVDRLDRSRLYAVVSYSSKTGAKPLHVWFLMFAKKQNQWVRIESSGKLSGGGVGSGPGIYKLSYSNEALKKFYQAWDWGPAYRPRNPDIDNWEYI
jgi:hypothetical protein